MKRTFDIVTSAGVLVLSCPLILVIMALIWIKLGPPVFFFQQRAGKGGKAFTLIKFRTMKSCQNSKGNLLPDAERLLPLGRLLRSMSLDEIPEFLNVLRGDMSIVGPRPLLMQYLGRYTPEQARRHEVKPGITGWAQVNGRNAITWEEKFEYDVWYVDHQSFLLDMKIIALTMKKVFKGEGINHPGQATMEEFMGYEQRRKHCLNAGATYKHPVH